MPTTNPHWRIAISLFCLLLAAYLFTYTGMPNSGDELALLSSADSWIRHGDMQIRSLYYQYPGPDIPPWSPPLHEPLQIVADAGLVALARNIEGFGIIHTVWLFNPFITALTGIILYLIGIELGYGRRVSFITALMIGLGTMLWPYTQTHFRESFAAFWVTVCVFLALKTYRDRRWGAVLIAACLAALLTKAILFIMFPTLLGLTLPTQWLQVRRHLLWLGLFVLIGVGCMAALNILLDNERFDLTSYFQRAQLSSPSYLFTVIGAYCLSPGRSLWATSPILLAALYGTVLAYRAGQRRLALAPWILLLTTTLAYGLGGWDWHGGRGWGVRYTLHIIPIMGLLLLPVVEKIKRRGWLALGGLMAVSLLIQGSALFVPLDVFYREMATHFPERALDSFYAEGLWQIRYTPWYLHLRHFDWNALPIAWHWGEYSGLSPLVCGLLALLGGLWWRVMSPILTIVTPLLVLVTSGTVVYTLRNDPRFLADRPELTALLQQVEAVAGEDDIIVLASPAYQYRFLNNYKGPATLTILPYSFGERYNPTDPEPPAPDLDQDGVIRYNERVDYNAQWFLNYLVDSQDYAAMWFVTETGPYHPWAYRPVEEWLVRNSFLADTLEIAPNARLLGFLPMRAQHYGELISRHEPHTFGEIINLVGYDIPAEWPVGKPLPIQLAWHPIEAIPKDYSVSSQLVDASGQVVVQRDGAPQGGFSPMTTLQTTLIYADHRALPLPADLPAGRYTVQVVIYNWQDMSRLPVDGGSAAVIADVTLLPPSP